MKIALIGYGRMGKAIERIATERGHEIVLRIGSKNHSEFNASALEGADVAIEFSLPQYAFENIVTCFEAGVPVVSGTTGWMDQYETAKHICMTNEGTLLYAANFSIGMNVMMVINNRLAELMNRADDYQVRLSEVHHIYKKDSPSGTAIALAKTIIEKNDRYEGWQESEEAPTRIIPISTQRFGKTPGTHKVSWYSEIDELHIEHIAKNRDGFARGAVLAAEWIEGKKGCFGMEDVIGLT